MNNEKLKELLPYFCEDEEFLTSNNVEEQLPTILHCSASALRNSYLALSVFSPLRIKHQQQRVFSEHLDKTNDREFFRYLRILRGTFNHILDIIQEQYHKVYRGGHKPVSATVALYLTLWYLGNDSTYREMSELFGVSESTVYDCVEKVIQILVKVVPRFIKWPYSNEVVETEKDFRQMTGFPGVVGALAACHVKIKAPNDIQDEYVNQASKASAILLAVCNSHKKFIFTQSGFPGSCSENKAWESSELYEKIHLEPESLFPNSDYHLLGGNGFALSRYVMVPFEDNGNLNPKQQAYNTKLSMVVEIVDGALANLLQRFHRLKYIQADIKRIPLIIQACCVLHNITLDFPEEDIALSTEEPRKPPTGDQECLTSIQMFICETDSNDEQGRHKRNSILNVI